MNLLKTRPGLVYVATLVMLVVAIPMLRAQRHVQAPQGWPSSISLPHRSSFG